MKLHVFCFVLPQSDACFIKAYPAETTERTPIVALNATVLIDLLGVAARLESNPA
jgi:transposase